MLNLMKVLVTGGSGFIGSTLIDALVRSGHTVRALMRESSSDALLKDVKFEKAIGDIRNYPSLVKACAGVDAVIHLAGLIGAKSRREFFEFNAEGTQNLGRAAADAGTVKQFVYVSSLAAAGPSHGLIPKAETDPDFPVSAYGESKLRGEIYLDELKDRLNFTVLRPPMVYGPRDRSVFMLFQMISKNWMPILKGNTNTGHKYYSSVYVDDLVDAMVLMLSEKGLALPSGERFFICDGQIYTMEKILGLMADTLKVDPIKIKIPLVALNAVGMLADVLARFLPANSVLTRDKFAEIIPDYWICSNDKLQRELGFEPKVHMPVGIQKTAAWYKVNGWLQ